MLMGLLAVTPGPAEAATRCNIVTGADVGSQRVARLYKAVFNRAPEPDGWNYWKGVHADTSLFEIADYFVQAPEFTSRYGAADNAQFVRLVYRNVMRRQPDTTGFEFWHGELERGAINRADMVVYFSESAELKRWENDVYFETCPLVAPARPSFLG